MGKEQPDFQALMGGGAETEPDNSDASRRASSPVRPKARGWRAKTATMLEQVNRVIQGILDLNAHGMWAETEMLLDRAQTVHAGMASMIASTDPSRDDVRDESYELIALLRGAKALAKSEDVPDVLSDALDTAIGLLNDASGGENPYLDGPRDDDDTPASPLKVVQAAEPELAEAVNALLALAERAIRHFSAAENTCESNTSGARLLAHAENHLHNLVRSIERGPLTSETARSWLIALSDIEAFLDGAVTDQDKVRSTLTRACLENVLAMKSTLKAQRWPEESDDDCRRREFMAGKALAVDMLEDAHDVERTDDSTPKSEVFAKFRGRGVPQDVSCMDYFDLVEGEPDLRAGFFAVVAQAIFEASDVMVNSNSADEIRNATFEDCYGGPDTVYAAKEDAGATP
jgi:hypothetical protein